MNIYIDEEEIEKFKIKYPEASEFELKVLWLRWDKWNYGDIQRILGNPSKKLIRSILLKYDKTLING